jgi:tetratricopeptide (TPR) repeat protein
MAEHFQRGLVLFQQSRYDLAEKELRRALADEPENPLGHAFLSLCLSHRDQHNKATEEAEQAVSLAPDQAFPFYALAKAHYHADRPKPALKAIDEAIAIDPEDADYFAFKASLLFDQRNWSGALEAAEQGLTHDAEHVGCTNLRAMALVKLGRKKEAGTTIDAALARDPDNAVTHANQGWTLLEHGEPKRAMEHFREALRLDPELDWARIGIVEALKAHHFVYRVMLKYFLWMSKLSGRAQWVVILAVYFGQRLVRTVAQNSPEFAPYAWPVYYAILAFVLLTWLADPLFNLLLRVNRFGRLALSREQIVSSNWVGGFLLAALISLSMAAVTGETTALWAAAGFGVMMLPVAGTFKCPKGGPRIAMAVYTSLLALAGLGALGFLMAQVEIGAALLGALFFLGVFLASWIVNLLIMAGR